MLGVGNLGQAIPSLGLVVLATIVIGIGMQTAVLALVAYAALPVLRNTMVGLEGVDPVARSRPPAAWGMSRMAVLLTVELPLAVPVILAGIRTALVLTVASARWPRWSTPAASGRACRRPDPEPSMSSASPTACMVAALALLRRLARAAGRGSISAPAAPES